MPNNGIKRDNIIKPGANGKLLKNKAHNRLTATAVSATSMQSPVVIEVKRLSEPYVELSSFILSSSKMSSSAVPRECNVLSISNYILKLLDLASFKNLYLLGLTETSFTSCFPINLILILCFNLLRKDSLLVYCSVEAVLEITLVLWTFKCHIVIAHRFVFS